jgi:hypothetical protein
MSKPLFVNVIERRSKLSGKDRIHVETAAGIHVGYIDLVSGDVVTEQSGFEHVMAACGARWISASRTAGEPRSH